MICPKCNTNINKFIISGDRCPSCDYQFVLKNNMITNSHKSTERLIVPLLIPLSATFFGMGITLLGIRFAGTAVTIFGALFTLTFMTMSASRIPAGHSSWALRFGLLGGIAGTLFGQFAPEIANILIGLSGGMILGAICGVVVMTVFISGGNILSFISGSLVPKKVSQSILAVGGVIGALAGGSGLYEVSINMYGPVGGAAALLSVLGVIVGISVSIQKNKETEAGNY